MRISLSRRAVGILLAAVLAIVAIAVSLVLTREGEPVAQPRQDIEPVTLAAPAEVAVPPHVLVIGDSWTYGAAATERDLGYAYRLASLGGWTVTVDGEPGSGYLKAGHAGTTFGERIAHLDGAIDPDLIVVQGSINDRRLPAEGYVEAVDAAWDDLVATYPDAEVVIFGPAPNVLPVEEATARIDGDLEDRAAARSWPYISPIQDGWITPANFDEVIDTSEAGANHPSDEGHRFLAERLTAALAPLIPSTTVDASGEGPTPLLEPAGDE